MLAPETTEVGLATTNKEGLLEQYPMTYNLGLFIVCPLLCSFANLIVN
jgi:hypothetical protein